MDEGTLVEAQDAAGAVREAGSARVLHYGDAAAEVEAARTRCALVDRSDLARIVGRGPDLLDLLHRLSTASVRQLLPGEGRATVLTTAKGRIVERLFVHPLGESGVLLIGGSGSAAPVIEHLARYTFAERTDLADVAAGTRLLAVVGPASAEALRGAGFDPPVAQHSASATLEERSLHVLGHDGLSADGFLLWLPEAVAGRAWRVLRSAVERLGGRAAGARALDCWRVLRGLPASGHELTAEHNPLEAGLWDAVDFDKGCYVGQEVVARLRTYDKVARSIVGLRFGGIETPPAPGTRLYGAGRPVGQVTSAVALPGDGSIVGLGYVKRREIRAGRRLALEPAGGDAVLAELPLTD